MGVRIHFSGSSESPSSDRVRAPFIRGMPPCCSDQITPTFHSLWDTCHMEPLLMVIPLIQYTLGDTIYLFGIVYKVGGYTCVRRALEISP